MPGDAELLNGGGARLPLAFGPMQMVASRFLLSRKEFPPSQTPGDWSLESLKKQIKQMTAGD